MQNETVERAVVGNGANFCFAPEKNLSGSAIVANFCKKFITLRLM